MEILYRIYAALVAAGVLFVVGAMLLGYFAARRRKGWVQGLRDKYLRAVVDALMTGDGEGTQFPMIRRRGARLVLAEVIAGLVAATYGLDQAPLRRIVERYGLWDYLLRRARWAQGYRRARFLSLLSRLPGDPRTVQAVARYIGSRNPYVRFAALTAQLAADPSTALRLMADYPYLFSSYEVSEIMTLLRRGMLPVAYEPLVLSPNRNLQAVGLGIIRQFGVEEAEAHLRKIAGGTVPGLGREALYILCALRRPLTGAPIARRIEAMSRAERKALMRYMALEGYSPHSIRRLFDEFERPYYESLVYSYKRCLV